MRAKLRDDDRALRDRPARRNPRHGVDDGGRRPRQHYPDRSEPGARASSYYTGTIMEINVPDLAGSLGGGGRYDGLVGMFLGRDVPACGFSLGLERIIVVMTERNMFPADVAGAGVDAGSPSGITRRAPNRWRWRRNCRKSGLRVDVYPEADKTRQAVQLRASRGVCRSSPFSATTSGRAVKSD